jgi:hypothetical protein
MMKSPQEALGQDILIVQKCKGPQVQLAHGKWLRANNSKAQISPWKEKQELALK